MKQYTPDEKFDALDALPEPARQFITSNDITDIFSGIGAKLHLNFQQQTRMCEIVNVILLGLEPQHSLEANLHQALPELSNADMRELVSDINDRIFKEAERRIRENIIDPSLQRDEAEYGPKPTKEDYAKYREQEKYEAEHPLSDDALHALAKEEREKKNAEEEEAERVADISRQEKVLAGLLPKSILGESTDEPDAEEDEEDAEEPQAPSAVSIRTTLGGAAATPAPAKPVTAPQAQPASIASQKLSAPSAVQKQETSAELAVPKAGVPNSQTPIYKGTDPYRESVE